MDNLNLSKLSKEIKARLLADHNRTHHYVVPHNAGSGIVTGWNAADTLPTIRLGVILPSLGQLKEKAQEICSKWCKRGLEYATEEELEGALQHRFPPQWYRFAKQCNVPEPNNLPNMELHESAWECFEGECLMKLLEMRQTTTH